MLPEMTKSEREVMYLLWNRPEPLSCTEIVNSSDTKHWKDSYVHTIVKSLLKKGYIKVASFDLISRSYARKFAPVTDWGTFVLHQVFSPEQLADREYMIDVWRKLIMSGEDIHVIEQIEAIVKKTLCRLQKQ